MKMLGVVVSVIVVAVMAEDYGFGYDLCNNVQPGLWKRDPQDCMIAHQCGFDNEITQSIRCNASQVWSKLASACVWEWDPDRDDCNGSPQVPIPRQKQGIRPRHIQIAGQNVFGSNPFGHNPMGINPNGVSPNGLNRNGPNPNGLHPNGLNPNGLNPNGIHPNGLNPNGKHPNGLNPKGINPMGLNPSGLNPSGLKQNDPRCLKKTGNNPDPDDCSRFVSCANGTLIAIQRCGDGTLYWPRNNTCEFAQTVVHDCGNRMIPETIVIRDDDPLCRENGQAPDPTSCRHFVLCQHGRRTQRIQCPHGTSFSEFSRKCEWHSDVNCANRLD